MQVSASEKRTSSCLARGSAAIMLWSLPIRGPEGPVIATRMPRPGRLAAKARATGHAGSLSLSRATMIWRTPRGSAATMERKLSSMASSSPLTGLISVIGREQGSEGAPRKRRSEARRQAQRPAAPQRETIERKVLSASILPRMGRPDARATAGPGFVTRRPWPQHAPPHTQARRQPRREQGNRPRRREAAGRDPSRDARGRPRRGRPHLPPAAVRLDEEPLDREPLRLPALRGRRIALRADGGPRAGRGAASRVRVRRPRSGGLLAGLRSREPAHRAGHLGPAPPPERG